MNKNDDSVVGNLTELYRRASALTSSEYRRVLESISGGAISEQRDVLLLRVMYDAFLPLSAALSLNVADFRWNKSKQILWVDVGTKRFGYQYRPLNKSYFEIFDSYTARLVLGGINPVFIDLANSDGSIVRLSLKHATAAIAVRLREAGIAKEVHPDLFRRSRILEQQLRMNSLQPNVPFLAAIHRLSSEDDFKKYFDEFESRLAPLKFARREQP